VSALNEINGLILGSNSCSDATETAVAVGSARSSRPRSGEAWRGRSAAFRCLLYKMTILFGGARISSRCAGTPARHPVAFFDDLTQATALTTVPAVSRKPGRAPRVDART
jgi:hypothetical protein